MIILINSNEILQIPAEEWLNSAEINFPIARDNSLALVIERNREDSSLSITNPKLIHSNCLNNKFVINPGKLIDSLQNDFCFRPLQNALSENAITRLSPDEISILSYFYLNTQPFSVSLISRWFSDAGTARLKADSLAKIVFLARTDKEDQEPDFINDIDRLHSRMIRESIQDNYRNTPLNLKDLFELTVRNPDYKPTYDSLGINHLLAEKSGPEIYLGELDETGFLIEDHAVIIAGLSVKVTEFAKLTEDKWPQFTTSLLNDIPIHFRDYYSLGRLLLEQSSLLLKLCIENNLEMSIICHSPYAENTSHLVSDFETLLFSNHFSEIPLILKIKK